MSSIALKLFGGLATGYGLHYYIKNNEIKELEIECPKRFLKERVQVLSSKFKDRLENVSALPLFIPLDE